MIETERSCVGLHGYFVVELGQPPDSPTWASLFLSGPRTARVEMMQSPVHGEAAALVQRSPVVEELAPSRQQAAGMGVGGGQGLKSNLGCYRGQDLAIGQVGVVGREMPRPLAFEAGEVVEPLRDGVDGADLGQEAYAGG